MTVLATERASLDREGYLLLEDVLDAGQLGQVRDRVEQFYNEEGENAGCEFRQEPGARRLANLLDKGPVFEQLAVMSRILEGVRQVLGERFKLSSFNARSANPYSQEAQPLHCDAGALPDNQGYWVCNTIWLLDDFTRENGATRIVPGSQNWGELPQERLANTSEPHAKELLVLGRAGSVVIMNTHAWHGGTANRTARPRRALHAFYCRWDKPQQQYQKRLLRAETQARLSPDLRKLAALDDPLNDRISAGEQKASGFLK